MKMKRLVYWYGVSHEDRGQADYAFVNESQLVQYEVGKKKGHGMLPNRILKKIESGQALTKKENLLKRGLAELEEDMRREKPDRALWTMHFKTDHDIQSSSMLSQPQSVASEKDIKTKSMKRKSNERSSVNPDGVVSSNSTVDNTHIQPPKRMRKVSLPSPVGSQHVAVKTESTHSHDYGKLEKESRLVVQELGKLHPDVIVTNDKRRELFALREQKPGSVTTLKGGSDTPITDSIINTMLSQNTTAANQNKAYAALKKAYPVWDDLANETDISRIENAIRVAGLAQARAERMQGMLRTIQSERGEANFEYLRDLTSTEVIQKELLRFKGMGPKTISCVMLFALGKKDFPVDTHVLRISKQMGWVPQAFSREQAYEYLNVRVPDECKLDLHCLLVSHGKQCNNCAANGRAQFPPKEQWVCPMSAIKNGKLVDAVKEEKLSKSEESESKINGSNNVEIKLEDVPSWCT